MLTSLNTLVAELGTPAQECPIPYSFSCHVGCHYLHYSSLNAFLCHL